METFNQILGILQNYSKATGLDLYTQAILMIISILGGVYWTIIKKKARRKAAKRAEVDDRQDNIGDNIKTEDQNTTDGQSVRDRLRRGRNDSE